MRLSVHCFATSLASRVTSSDALAISFAHWIRARLFPLPPLTRRDISAMRSAIRLAAAMMSLPWREQHELVFMPGQKLHRSHDWTAVYIFGSNPFKKNHHVWTQKRFLQGTGKICTELYVPDILIPNTQEKKVRFKTGKEVVKKSVSLSMEWELLLCLLGFKIKHVISTWNSRFPKKGFF